MLAPIGLALGIRRFGISRLCSAALCGCMLMATWFHIDEKGLEGFPLGIVEAHSYGYELSGLYAFVFAYFTAAGPGKLALGLGAEEEEEEEPAPAPVRKSKTWWGKEQAEEPPPPKKGWFS